MIIDNYGDVHSLSRDIEGVRSKQIKEKLSDIDPDSIPSIADVQAQIQKPQEPPVKKLLQAKLDELQSQRRVDLTNEMEDLETSQREKLLFLKITQQHDFEQTSIRLMTSALNLFAYIPTMRFAVHYLHTKIFARIRKLHKREIPLRPSSFSAGNGAELFWPGKRVTWYKDQCWRSGTRTVMPSISSVRVIWQDRRLLS